MELFSVFGGYFRRRSNAASDRHHAEQDVARLANRYDQAIRRYLPSLIDDTHFAGEFTTAHDIPNTTEYIHEIVQRRFMQANPFEVILPEEGAGGLWLQQYGYDIHAIKLLDALIVDLRNYDLTGLNTHEMKRFALMSIQVPNDDGLNTLMFYRLGNEYYSIINIERPDLISGTKSGQVNGNIFPSDRGIFGELYTFLQNTKGNGLVDPDFENFLVAPFSKVAVDSFLTDPKNRVVA